MSVEVYHQIKEMVLAFREPMCAIEGCSGQREVRHLCENHYAKLKRAGVSFVGMPFIKPSASHHFLVDLLSSPQNNECVLWPLSQTEGYGHLGYKSKTYRVHVLVCEAVHGPKPMASLHAAHECGNSLCCNPRHLSWKTAFENAQDKLRHGTAMRGVRHHQAKLTEDDVLAIRSLRGKVTRKNIALQFGIGRATVDNVIDKTTWKHL